MVQDGGAMTIWQVNNDKRVLAMLCYSLLVARQNARTQDKKG